MCCGPQVWQGYSQSVAVTQDGPQVFMDVAVMGIPVVETLMDWMNMVSMWNACCAAPALRAVGLL